MARSKKQKFTGELPFPEAIERELPKMGGHAGVISCHGAANMILSNAAKYANDPNAQKIIAAAAMWKMDKEHRQPIGGSRAHPKFFPSNYYKPNLAPALVALIKAKTLTPDTISPQLAKALSTFEKHYPTDPQLQIIRPLLMLENPSSRRFVDRVPTRKNLPLTHSPSTNHTSACNAANNPAHSSSQTPSTLPGR